MVVDKGHGGSLVPFKASRTLMEPPVAAESPAISTSSAAATGDVGSSPSDYKVNKLASLYTRLEVNEGGLDRRCIHRSDCARDQPKRRTILA